MNQQSRLYSIDNLRATMMWLGIVLHVADLHVTSEAPMPWLDSQTSSIADVLVGSIHAFRMPVFFIVAGFFVSLLVERRGVQGMLANRTRRLALPFAVFWPILFAIQIVLATLLAQPRGAPFHLGFNPDAMPVLPNGSRLQTMHLWFLEILMGLVLVAAAGFVVALRTPVSLRERLRAAFAWFVTRWWAFLPLALPLAWVSQRHAFGVLKASAMFVPLPSEWAFAGMFFVFGIAMYWSRDRVLPFCQRHCWQFALGGTLAFVLVIVLNVLLPINPAAIPRQWFFSSLLYNSSGWLWSFALIGCFTRYLTRQPAALRYAAESSYWVYLVHLPCVIAVEYVIRDWATAAPLKMILNIAITSIIALVSYELLVRRTVIGVLLNGHRATTSATHETAAHTARIGRDDGVSHHERAQRTGSVTADV